MPGRGRRPRLRYLKRGGYRTRTRKYRWKQKGGAGAATVGLNIVKQIVKKAGPIALRAIYDMTQKKLASI